MVDHIPLLELLAVDADSQETGGQLMLELERIGGQGVVVDCLDRFRLMQKSDAEKHVSLRRMLLEAQVETHEGSLLRIAWMIISLSSLNSALTDFIRSSAFATTSGIGCADNSGHLTLG
ncbi:hypothetical protein Tco_0686459 [Tanacetum coccineum]